MSNQDFSSDQWDVFLQWLDPANLNDNAYEAAHRRLMFFFTGRRCPDPATLADRTLDIAMRKFSDVPGNVSPLSYLIGIARNIFKESLRSDQKHEIIRQHFTEQQSTQVEETETHHSCLEKCLTTLPVEDRQILLAYYSQTKQAKIDIRRQLAEKEGLSMNSLRNRILRLNQRLKPCLTQCLGEG